MRKCTWCSVVVKCVFHTVSYTMAFVHNSFTLFPQLQAHHKNSMQLLTHAWKKTKSFITSLFNLMKQKGIRAKVTRKTRPPVSPHLTLLDIFMWGYVDNSVFSENICKWYHLQGRIYIAVMTVTLDMICYTWNKRENQVNVCRTTDTIYIETYYGYQKSL
jgi:hypothetical protein